MGKQSWRYSAPPTVRGLCIKCKTPFCGKGDRCQHCADDLTRRRKRKRR